MILQALTDYYRVLEQAGKIDAPGWAPVKVSYALLLSENGTLEQVIDIQTEQPRGKKMVSAPQILSLPAPVKRTVGVAANFLCDNAGYLLGIDSKGKPQRTRECFEASRSLHERLLAGVDSPPPGRSPLSSALGTPRQPGNTPLWRSIWRIFSPAAT